MLKPAREIGLKPLPQVASDSKQPQFDQQFVMWYTDLLRMDCLGGEKERLIAVVLWNGWDEIQTEIGKERQTQMSKFVIIH